MMKVNLTFLVSLLLLSMLSGTGLKAMSPSARSKEDLAIIVNQSNPVDNLSVTDLRKLFLAQQQHWTNSRKVTLVMREPGQPERNTILREIYRMTESSFSRYFLHGQYTGEIQSTPKLLASASGVRKFVVNVPGAIGYVRLSEVDDSVKVVHISGRLPGESGYPLKVQN
jgi:phosphate transport system substrate-binding protein